MMNEELHATSALLVQNGALFFSYNSLSTFLQSSNVKPTQVCSAPAGRQVFNKTSGTSKGIMTSILHLKMPTEN
jgi:hypothetical protein